MLKLSWFDDTSSKMKFSELWSCKIQNEIKDDKMIKKKKAEEIKREIKEKKGHFTIERVWRDWWISRMKGHINPKGNP